MLVLPVELRMQIMEPLDINNLTKLRAAGSKELCELTTPMVFRIMRFNNDIKDTEILKEVIASGIQHMVQEIHIRISDQTAFRRKFVGLASINRPYPEALEFAGITSQFSSLTHIKISFHETLGSCLPHNNLILGEAMLTNYMISNPQHHSSQMTSLALSGILAFPGFLIRSDSAADALASLTHLDIHFNYIDDERMISKFRSLANARRLASIDIYFPSSIKPRVNPPPWKLTHLTLTAAAELVYFQPIDFGALQLPNLTVLVVENMTLRTSPTDSLEDFIVRHTTVRKLVLRDCMLVHTRRYWSEVYDRISSALARLVDLSVGFGPPHREWVNGARVGPSWFGLDEVTPIKEGFTLGYCYMGSLDARDDFKFVRDFVFDPAAVVRDGAALKRLQAKVEERAQARTGF